MSKIQDSLAITEAVAIVSIFVLQADITHTNTHTYLSNTETILHIDAVSAQSYISLVLVM